MYFSFIVSYCLTFGGVNYCINSTIIKKTTSSNVTA
jgi:hypothetical protein